MRDKDNQPTRCPKCCRVEVGKLSANSDDECGASRAAPDDEQWLDEDCAQHAAELRTRYLAEKARADVAEMRLRLDADPGGNGLRARLERMLATNRKLNEQVKAAAVAYSDAANSKPFVNGEDYIAQNLWDMLQVVSMRGDWWADLRNWCKRNMSEARFANPEPILLAHPIWQALRSAEREQVVAFLRAHGAPVAANMIEGGAHTRKQVVDDVKATS